MKKRLFTLLALSLTSVVACSSTPASFKPYLDDSGSLPVFYASEGTSHTTYLMMSRYGYLDLLGAPTKGKVAEKFYEETIVWVAEPGSELPDAKSEVSGVTFDGWAYFDENSDETYPTYLSTVPEKEGLALKAMFSGTDASGGGGGHTPTPDPDTYVTYTVTALPYWMPDNDPAVFAWCWGGSCGDGTWFKITLNVSGSGETASVTGTFEAPSDITGFNMARCVNGTTKPNWNVRDNGEGRVYNKSGDVVIVSGRTSYASPDWVEYNVSD